MSTWFMVFKLTPGRTNPLKMSAVDEDVERDQEPLKMSAVDEDVERN